MITNYHRPKTLDEALTLLSQPGVVPLGGGTLLSKGMSESIQVVDLQLLKMDSIKQSGNNLEIGSTATLQTLLESDNCPAALRKAIKLEAPLNIRNTATLAGTLISCDGRSPLAVILLALDAKVDQVALVKSKIKRNSLSIGDFLPLRPKELITSVTIPLNINLAFEYVSKTPSDKPMVCAAVAQWNSGRTRLSLGGYGKTPILGMDGTESEGIETAARNAFHESGDEYASADYRMELGATLSKRCLSALK